MSERYPHLADVIQSHMEEDPEYSMSNWIEEEGIPDVEFLAMAQDAELGAARVEAEAALPEGAWLKIEGPHDAPHADWYTVEAVMWTEHTTKIVQLAKIEAPLAAALRALAAKLREVGR